MMINNIILESKEKEILKTLNKYGKGYIVGGYIRDILLGFEPKDCDFATDIEYDKLKIIFKEYRPVEIGKSFGIVQITYKGKKFEIAKLRKDLKFFNSRNKTKIEFIDDITEDLKRRDFTVNGIAFDGEKLFFPTPNAIEDIENRVLRFIGDAESRIKEDPLRILRGIRIAGEKNLDISEECRDKIAENRFEIKRVSIERVRTEFLLMIESNFLERTIEIFYQLKMMEVLFPITVRNNEITEFINNMKKVSHKDDSIKLALFFMKSKDELLSLKFSRNTTKKICNIIENYDIITDNLTSVDIKRFIFTHDLETLNNIIELKRALGNKFISLEEKLYNILKRKEVIELKELKITGNDLKRIGNIEEKERGKVLMRCLTHVWSYPKFNDKDYLIRFIEKGMKK